jgi:hypothetical protein
MLNVLRSMDNGIRQLKDNHIDVILGIALGKNRMLPIKRGPCIT